MPARSISTRCATSRLSDAERTRIRRIEIGFVYQFHHLLMEFSALENVILPQMIRGLSRQEAARRATDLLGYLGLKERLTHRPAELSGGEQQRVAIARAVANAPRILLADEPTGNLDPRTSEHVFSALTQLVQASGLAVVVATHNMEIAGAHGPPRHASRTGWWSSWSKRHVPGALRGSSVSDYFGTCTSVASCSPVSGAGMYLNFTASPIMSSSPTMRTGSMLSLVMKSGAWRARRSPSPDQAA